MPASSFVRDAWIATKVLCTTEWKRTLLWLGSLPSLLLILDMTQQHGLPTLEAVLAAIATFLVLLVAAALVAATRLMESRESTKMMRVADLYVKCMYPKVSRPLAASDCCGEFADTAVELPDGSRSWRCSEHRGLVHGNVTGPVHETVERAA